MKLLIETISEQISKTNRNGSANGYAYCLTITDGDFDLPLYVRFTNIAISDIPFLDYDYLLQHGVTDRDNLFGVGLPNGMLLTNVPLYESIPNGVSIEFVHDGKTYTFNDLTNFVEDANDHATLTITLSEGESGGSTE